MKIICVSVTYYNSISCFEYKADTLDFYLVKSAIKERYLYLVSLSSSNIFASNSSPQHR